MNKYQCYSGPIIMANALVYFKHHTVTIFTTDLLSLMGVDYPRLSFIILDHVSVKVSKSYLHTSKMDIFLGFNF